jgi:hypothetical protein
MACHEGRADARHSGDSWSQQHERYRTLLALQPEVMGKAMEEAFGEQSFDV